MTTDPIKKSTPCFPPTYYEFLKNHQKWEITLKLDCKAGHPTVYVKDPHEICHEITEIIIENIALDLEEHLLVQCLQNRLSEATPYQVHIINHEGQLYLYLGAYGLKGGGRETALALSAAQLGLGTLFLSSRKLKIPGIALISAGLAGVYYVCQKTQENFRWNEYGLQTLQGVMTGAFTGGVAQVCQGLEVVGRMMGQVAGGVIGNGASAAAVQMIQSGSIDGAFVLNKACRGGIGTLAGTFTGEMFNGLLPSSEGVQAVALQAFKGGVSAATSKVATNLYEGEEFFHEVLEAAMMGGVVGGFIAGVEQLQKFQELRAEKTQHESTVQKLKDKLQQVQNELASKKISLAQQRTSQMEQSVAEAQQAADLAAQQLKAAEKIAKQMEQSYEQSALRTDREIKSFIGRGYKAKTKNHITKSADTIREALLNGERVEWIPMRNPHEQKWTVQKNPFKLHALRAQARVLQTQQIVAEWEATIAYKQTELTLAELQRELIRESAWVSQCTTSTGQNISLNAAQWGILEEVFQTPSISYVDCDMNELISHVVLVHAVSQDSVMFHKDYDWTQVGDFSHIVQFLLKNQVAPDGTIGQYLELEKREFSEEFEHRPQMHWAWNQLVQPHNGALLGGWEGAHIAFLEPLSAFEKSHPHKPFGIAPYDTMVFGSVRLSEKSTVLAPAPFVAGLQAYLTGFRGRVVGYDPSKSLRTAVMETLCAHYPETWHVCDPQGKLLGSEARHTTNGYHDKTCLKRTDGRVHILIHGGGGKPEDQPSQAMQDYHKAKRFIGLHNASTTYWLENTDYFKFLKIFSINKGVAKNHPLLVGHEKKMINTSTLGILEAFIFYQKLIQDSPPQTGGYTVANYVLKEALFADLVSLFFQLYPDRNFKLSTLDVQMIVSPVLGTCKRILKQIESCVKNADQPKAREGFTQYVSLLKACLTDILNVQKQVVQHLKDADQLKTEKVEVDFGVAQKEWDLVQVPESIEFDLGEKWPLKPELHAYVSRVFHLLPKKTNQLKSLYHQLEASRQQLEEGEDKKELYRINVFCSTVQWALQEKIYLKLIKADSISPLAPLFTRHESWLKDHHLEVCDFTQKLGDCLFDNVIAQAGDLSSKTADALRKNLVDFMRAHSEDYKSKPEYQDRNFLEIAEGGEALSFTNWDSYLECIAKPQVWVTELEIQALSLLLQRPIVLISAGAIPKIYNSQGANSPIFLNHKNWNHFESCRPLSPHTQQEIYQTTQQETHY